MLILKVTGDCNLRCRYCYACGGKDRRAMSWEVARASLDYCIERTSSFGIQFTGGEPLLEMKLIMTIDDYLRRKGVDVLYQLQTNATLIDLEMARKLRRMRVRVGVSLDGPPSVNDGLRPLADGGGSTLRVIKGLENLKEAGIMVGVTTVLTGENVTTLPKLVDFLSYLGNIYGVTFDYLRPIGRALRSDISYPSDTTLKRGLRAALERADEIAALGGPRVHFRELDCLRHVAERSLARRHYCYATTGESMIVTQEGEVYPCPSLVGIPEFCLGNILDRGFDLEKSTARSRLAGRSVEVIPACRACDLAYLCGGGCAARAYAFNGSIDRPFWGDCLIKKVFIDYFCDVNRESLLPGRHNARVLSRGDIPFSVEAP